MLRSSTVTAAVCAAHPDLPVAGVSANETQLGQSPFGQVGMQLTSIARAAGAVKIPTVSNAYRDTRLRRGRRAARLFQPDSQVLESAQCEAGPPVWFVVQPADVVVALQ